jgi:hypothetical protein
MRNHFLYLTLLYTFWFLTIGIFPTPAPNARVLLRFRLCWDFHCEYPEKIRHELHELYFLKFV